MPILDVLGLKLLAFGFWSHLVKSSDRLRTKFTALSCKCPILNVFFPKIYCKEKVAAALGGSPGLMVKGGDS